MALKDKLRRLTRKEYFWISVLTFIVLAMHFSIIFHPPTIILDETYYVNDARHILAGDAQVRGEHPPLGSLLITLGMLIFGDNSLGWRFFAVLMGSAAVFLLYLVCRRLEMSPRASLLASFLLAFENLTFVQSGVAMLDVYTVFFMLLSFWLYLRKNYPLASVAGAFSVLAKLTGALGFLAIGLHWLLKRRDRWPYFLSSMTLAPLLFVMLLPLFDFFVTRHLLDPLQRIANIFKLGGSITFESSSHPSATRPWTWLISLQAMPYAYDPDYFAVLSPTLWALAIPSVVYLAYKIKKGCDAALFGIAWFTTTYLLWIPLDMVTNRLSYIYYFYPAVGSIALGLGMGLSDLWGLGQRREKGKLKWLLLSLFWLFIGLHIAVFIFLSPVFSWWLPPWPRMIFWPPPPPK